MVALLEPDWIRVEGLPYEFDLNSLGGYWFRVRGEGLTHDLWTKFKVTGAGVRLIGLKFDSCSAITARQLREPRIADLEAAFGRFLTYALEELDCREAEVRAAVQDDNLEAEARESWSAFLDEAKLERERWLSSLGDVSGVEVRSGGRGASPPSETKLRAFASEYLIQAHLGRGAVPRTARAVGMDRSTVYRWMRICRERGLLPPREDS